VRYPKTHVQQALVAARQAGIDVAGLKVGDDETELTLERAGLLPIDSNAVETKVSDWYVRNGLATRDTVRRETSQTTAAALEAAEAALQAATAALRLAKQLGGEAA
jgi:multidrug resistance efflux pump